jgi:hypothetical protein
MGTSEATRRQLQQKEEQWRRSSAAREEFPFASLWKRVAALTLSDVVRAGQWTITQSIQWTLYFAGIVFNGMKDGVLYLTRGRRQ